MIEVQNYKGDETELKFKASGMPAFDLTIDGLEEFNQQAYNTDAFLLMLYDEGRMPYSQRVKREVFVAFMRKALENFPFIGNFESYLFILGEIFGKESVIFFEIPAPGKLSISVDASSDILYEATARELSSGAYTFYELVDMDGNELVYKALSGIETEEELYLLFSEIMPAGLVPTISLDFFLKSTFYGAEPGAEFDIITSLNDTLIFIEVSGG
jgi:hypothetical protein